MHLTRALPAGRLLTLVCLLVSLHIPHASATTAGRNPSKAREPRASTSRARGAQDAEVFETKTYNLTAGDYERARKFRLLLLMRAYAVITNPYYELAVSAADWDTVSGIFVELAAISHKFKQHTEPPDDPQLTEFFSACADYLKRQAELCDYIKGRLAEGSLSPEQSAVLFGRLVSKRPPKGQQRFEMVEVLAIEFIVDLAKANEKGRVGRVVPIMDHFRRRYGIEVPSLIAAGLKLPFKLPFEEFEGAHDYLYETLVRDAGVSDFLKLHYQNDVVRIAGKVGIETVFNTMDIGTFYLELVRVDKKMGTFADTVMGTMLDCAGYNRRVAKRAYYSDAYDLHTQVHARVAGETAYVKETVEFVRKELGDSVGAGQLRKGDGGSLLAFAEEYLKQRAELEAYVKKQQNLAAAALRRFDKDGGDLLVEGLTKPILAGVSGRLRELMPGPCRTYEIIKKKR